MIDKILPARTAQEWLEEMEKEGLIVDIIQDYSYVENDQQALENQFIIKQEHPNRGQIKMVGTPLMLSKAPPSIRNLAPCPGQNTTEILSYILNYDYDEIVHLRAEGIIS